MAVVTRRSSRLAKRRKLNDGTSTAKQDANAESGNEEWIFEGIVSDLWPPICNWLTFHDLEDIKMVNSWLYKIATHPLSLYSLDTEEFSDLLYSADKNPKYFSRFSGLRLLEINCGNSYLRKTIGNSHFNGDLFSHSMAVGLTRCRRLKHLKINCIANIDDLINILRHIIKTPDLHHSLQSIFLKTSRKDRNDGVYKLVMLDRYCEYPLLVAGVLSNIRNLEYFALDPTPIHESVLSALLMHTKLDTFNFLQPIVYGSVLGSEETLTRPPFWNKIDSSVASLRKMSFRLIDGSLSPIEFVNVMLAVGQLHNLKYFEMDYKGSDAALLQNTVAMFESNRYCFLPLFRGLRKACFNESTRRQWKQFLNTVIVGGRSNVSLVNTLRWY